MKQDWTRQINELDQYFQRTELPPAFKLSEHERIVHLSTFISSHISICRAYNGNEFYLPYLRRLLRIKQLLQNAGN